MLLCADVAWPVVCVCPSETASQLITSIKSIDPGSIDQSTFRTI